MVAIETVEEKVSTNIVTVLEGEPILYQSTELTLGPTNTPVRMLQPSDLAKAFEPIKEAVTQMFPTEIKATFVENVSHNYKCEGGCGQRYITIEKKPFWCDACYDAFNEEVNRLVKKRRDAKRRAFR